MNKQMITDRSALPLGELLVLWLLAGFVSVFFSLQYSLIVKIPVGFASDNEIINLIQGGIFLSFGVLALSRLNVDFGAAYKDSSANIESSFKLAFKYFSFYVAGAAAVVALAVLVFMLSLRLGLFTMETFDNYYFSMMAGKLAHKNYFRDIIAQSPCRLLVYLFSTCVLIPIEEEIFMRRLLYVSLRHKAGIGISLTISSILFGAIHVGGACLPAVVAGFFLGWIYEKHKNLPVNMMTHGLINFFVTIVLFFI